MQRFEGAIHTDIDTTKTVRVQMSKYYYGRLPSSRASKKGSGSYTQRCNTYRNRILQNHCTRLLSSHNHYDHIGHRENVTSVPGRHIHINLSGFLETSHCYCGHYQRQDVETKQEGSIRISPQSMHVRYEPYLLRPMGKPQHLRRSSTCK
jgi:hypothetical protein